MWYVIQTITGKEQEIVDEIKSIVPPTYYKDCFFIQREGTRREKEILFPSYVFVITDHPGQLFFELKKIPGFTRLLKGQDNYFPSVTEEEQIFLDSIQDQEEHIVRCSLVETDEHGRITKACGPLEKYKDKIVKQRLRKRYVLIEQELLGKKRNILLGIRLRSDMEI